MKKIGQPLCIARSAGVTLIELVITIALVGILAALIVNFIQPVRSYIDSSRRAAVADAADTSLRRIGRDLRLALPNSVRVNVSGDVNVNGRYVEFLLVRTGGRYRIDAGSPGTNTCNDGASSTPANDLLTFGAADSCFKTLGPVPNLPVVIGGGNKGDFLVVFNLPTTSPVTANADAYEHVATGGNKSALVGITTGTLLSAGQDLVRFTNHTFTYESPGNRFFVIEGPVTYGCAGGTLTRYWGYDITPTQTVPPAVLPTSGGGSSAVMATGVTDCTFTYDTSLAAQGAGLVTMSLRLNMQNSQGGTETVSLYHAVHVNNVP